MSVTYNTPDENTIKIADLYVEENQTGSLYGHADYTHALRKQVNDPGWMRNVNQVRQAVGRFLDANKNAILTADNRGPGGLLDQLTNEDYTYGTTQYGNSGRESDVFNYWDFIHARAWGRSDAEIVEWLDQNPTIRDTARDDIYNHIWTHGNVQGYDRPERPGTWTPGTVAPIPGEGGSKYGDGDYYRGLKDLWDNPEDPKNPNTLAQYREDVLDLLENGPDDQVYSGNRRYDAERNEMTSGLWYKINHFKVQRETERTGSWYPDQINITESFGLASEPEQLTQFTEQDYLAARASGHTDYDVYKYLRANPDKYTSTEARSFYNTLRSDLIEAAPDPNAYDDSNWKELLESPLWQELGEYFTENRITGNWDRDWVDKDDFVILHGYLRSQLDRREGVWSDHFRTEADLERIIGPSDTSTQTGSGGWETGEYWSTRYGAEGPPDRPDSPGDRDLTAIEKMVTGAAVRAQDESTWEDRLEYLENRFLTEMYEGRPDGSDVDNPYEPRFNTDAQDHWGLDIRRADFDYDDNFWNDDGDELLDSQEADLWYETLTKGDIDWDFYRESATYNAARVALGMDEEISTVAEIRQANVWVHGQEAVIEGTTTYDAYVPIFDKDKATPYEPRELTIQNYTPANKKGLATPRAEASAPTINVAPFEVTKPSNLTGVGTTLGTGTSD